MGCGKQGRFFISLGVSFYTTVVLWWRDKCHQWGHCMLDGLEKNQLGQTRTLYSLRHTYATFELLNNKTDIHTLSKQMGNSSAIIKRHYSKFSAMMAAERLV